MSDSHGLTKEVAQIVHRYDVEQKIHCGDFCVDAHTPPFATIIKVRGNCDFALDVPTKKALDWLGLKVVLVHGHKHRVKQSPLSLMHLAEQERAQVVLFGHSHQPTSFMEKGVLYINPGSLYQPRGYKTPTYVVAGIERFADAHIVKVQYYNLEHVRMDDLGGVYKIARM